MPEGPECRVMALKLHAQLAKKTITSITTSFHLPLIQSSLPLVVYGLSVKGKKIIFILFTPKEKKVLFLISSLGMEGRWLFQEARHTRLTFHFDQEDLYYDDSRKFGRLEEFEDLHSLLTKLDTIGCDLLNYAISLYQGTQVADQMTRDRWRSIFQLPKLQNHQLVQILLEQKYFSGIGNYLKSEILYRARLKPDRLISSLNQEDIEKLRISSLETIYESFLSGGLTLRSYLDPTGQRGTFKHAVYAQKTDPLGHEVCRSIFKDKRTTFWVPDLQV